jgi:tetratricopeptide (TPR) repeat protein
MNLRWLLLLAAFLQFACQRDPESKAVAAIERAKTDLERKDYPRALLNLRIALKESPANAEAFYQAGLVHLAMLEIPSAYVNLKKAVEINPKHIAAQNRLAELFSSSNRKDHLEEAAEIAQQVLDLDPDDSIAANALAISTFKLGDAATAESALKAVLKSDKADLRSFVNAALLRLHANDPQAAIQILNQASTRLPESQEIALLLARLHGLRRDDASARSVLESAVRHKTVGPLTWATLASLYATVNRPDEALKAYRNAAAFNQPDFDHYPAMYLWVSGKKQEALDEFTAIHRKDPRDYVSRRRLVNALRLLGRDGEADLLLRNAFERNPKDTEALVGHCQSLVRSGHLEEAISKLRQIIADDAGNFRAHYLLSKIHLARRHFDQQRQELDETLRLNPGFLAARLELAKAQISAGRIAGAMEVLNRATPEQKQTSLWHESMNWALLAKGDLNAASAGIDRLLAQAPTNEGQLQKAFLLLAQKQFSPARQLLETILAKQPDSVLAFDTLGNSYAYENRMNDGLKSLAAHAQRHPALSQIQFAYSIWLSRAGKTVEAEDVLRRAKQFAPKELSIDVRLGELAFASKRFSDARAHLARALSITPAIPRAQMLLAHIEAIAGHRDLAIAGYRYVIELDGNNAEAHNNLASLLSETDASLDEALQFAQRAKELSSADPNYSDTLGWILYRKGLYLEAIPLLESAQSSANPVVAYHLAMAYAKSGDLNRAKQIFSRANKAAPTLAEARQARDLVFQPTSRMQP